MESKWIELIASNPAHKGKVDSKSAGVYQAKMDAVRVDRATRTVSALLTTQQVDAEKEVIVTDGIDLDSYYPGNVKAVYWNHDYWQMPVGVCRKLVRLPTGLWQQTHIKAGPFGDDLIECIDIGAVGHMSIGFSRLDHGMPKPEEAAKWPEAEYVTRRSLALEGSFVSMPGNPHAKIEELVVKGLVSRGGAKRLGLPEVAVAAGKRRLVLSADGQTLRDAAGRLVLV